MGRLLAPGLKAGSGAQTARVTRRQALQAPWWERSERMESGRGVPHPTKPEGLPHSFASLVPSGGGVFRVVEEVSDRTLLRADVFNDKERHVFQRLTSVTLSLPVKETYYIRTRIIWQPCAKRLKANRRQGRHAVLLHDLRDGQRTSSWLWLKFIRPLYKQGFSVVCIDWPGHGGSRVSDDPDSSSSRWRAQAPQLVGMCMDELGVEKANFVAFGGACEVMLELMRYYRAKVDTCHAFINPVLEKPESLWSEVSVTTYSKPNWKEEVLERQMRATAKAILESRTCLWSLFPQLGGDEGTYKFLEGVMADNRFATRKMVMSTVNSDMLSSCRVMSEVPVRLLFPARPLKREVAKFLAQEGFDAVQVAEAFSLKSTYDITAAESSSEFSSTLNFSSRQERLAGGSAGSGMPVQYLYSRWSSDTQGSDCSMMTLSKSLQLFGRQRSGKRGSQISVIQSLPHLDSEKSKRGSVNFEPLPSAGTSSRTLVSQGGRRETASRMESTASMPRVSHSFFAACGDASTPKRCSARGLWSPRSRIPGSG